MRINSWLPLTRAKADDLLSSSRLGVLKAESLQQRLLDQMTNRQWYDDSNSGGGVWVGGGGGWRTKLSFLS